MPWETTVLRTLSIELKICWFGWKQSDQAETYVHENDDKMRQARLAEEGIEPDESDDGLQRQECGRCGTTAAPTTDYCPHCSMALTTDAAVHAQDGGSTVEDDVSKEEPKEQLEELRGKVVM